MPSQKHIVLHRTVYRSNQTRNKEAWEEAIRCQHNLVNSFHGDLVLSYLVYKLKFCHFQRITHRLFSIFRLLHPWPSLSARSPLAFAKATSHRPWPRSKGRRQTAPTTTTTSAQGREPKLYPYQSRRDPGSLAFHSLEPCSAAFVLEL